MRIHPAPLVGLAAGVVSLAVSAALLTPTEGVGQARSSVGAGPVVPTGRMDDVYERGFTVRVQTSLSLLVVDAHLQTGWTRLPVDPSWEDVEALDNGGELDTYHAGLGARVGLGFGWAGANVAYFFGEGDEGWGLLPEVGVGLGPLEIVADYRIDGDAHWAALRAALRF